MNILWTEYLRLYVDFYSTVPSLTLSATGLCEKKIHYLQLWISYPTVTPKDFLLMLWRLLDFEKSLSMLKLYVINIRKQL